MAIMWSGSLVPWIDANGNPFAGAKLFMFDAETTTPRTVYRDGGQNEVHDHPVVADGAGRFPAVFLQSGDFRERMETSDGQVIHDVDLITAPNGEAPIPPDAGDTDPKLLFATGMIVARHGTGALSGWVRVNARTIGSASSGASERANDDCEALFLFLWDQDSTLAVSGGRGANAASDWATNKNIALPDYRSRALVGLAGMGNTALTILADTWVDGSETASSLGATAGVDDVAITIAQLPVHSHGGTTGAAGAHHHNTELSRRGGSSGGLGLGIGWSTHDVVYPDQAKATDTEPAHSHTIANQGSGAAHNNMQPSVLITFYIKL